MRSRGEAWLELAVRRYASFDRRTLGFARICVGLVLVGDLVHRGKTWLDVYGADGLFPPALAVDAPHLRPSIFWWISSPGALTALWCALAVVYACFTLGLFTRVAHVAALVCWASTIDRYPMASNGGYTLVLHFLVWLLVLPLGERFSLDALRLSLRRRREKTAAALADREAMDARTADDRAASFAALLMLAQIFVVYAMGVLTKTGPSWVASFDAVYWAIANDAYVTPIVAALRGYAPLWLIHVATGATLFAEGSAAACVLVGGVWPRRYALACLVGLHLVFGTAMPLGPFAWGCIAVDMLLLDTADFDAVREALRRRWRARTVLVDEADADAMLFARALARLDGLGLLRFVAAGEAWSVKPTRGLGRSRPIETRGGIAVRVGSELVTGRRALREIVAALPLGPLLAPFVALPGIGDAVIAAAPRLLRALVALPSGRWPKRAAARRNIHTLMLIPLAFLVAVAASQGLARLTPGSKRNPILAWLPDRVKINQSWVFFAPDPPTREKLTVMDIETADGRHVDPLTGKSPRTTFDGPAAIDRIPQHVRDVMSTRPSPALMRAAVSFMRKYADRTGDPRDRLVRGRIYRLTSDLVWREEPSPPAHIEDVATFGPTGSVSWSDALLRRRGPAKGRRWEHDDDDDEPGN